jgi:hypothetical protein
MSARDRLNAALLVMAERQDRPRCGEWHEGEPWTSEDAELRAWAAAQCTGCPLLEVCAAVGTEERHAWGVWGGTDRSPSRRNVGRPKTEQTA